jgi:hypothetical protein
LQGQHWRKETPSLRVLRCLKQSKTKTEKEKTMDREQHNPQESLKREKSLRLGDARVKIPNDIHVWLSPFASARSYSHISDAIWYLLRVCKSSLPMVEKVTVQVGDNQGQLASEIQPGGIGQ